MERGFSGPPKTLLFLRVSESHPGGGVLSCPAPPFPEAALGGGPCRAPCPGTRRPGAGRPASAQRSLPVGGIPRPRRAPPGAERRGAGRGAGDRANPAAPGTAGGRVLPGEMPLMAVPPLLAFLLFFLALLRRHLPGWDGSKRKMHKDKSRSLGAAKTPGLNCPH